MELNRFQKTLKRQNEGRPPVWFMRQAGRYHSHYQALRASHSFIDLCKVPKLACEVTLGPIHDFDYDAAILFSDLLFPLEAMGTGLKYDPGPKLDRHIKTLEDLKGLSGGRALAQHMDFQGEATRLIRNALPASKGLLGFVGGPLTLYCYAVEGSHQGKLESSKQGLRDGRYGLFLEKLLDLLAENMAIQARSGIDTIAVLDTCAGEFSLEEAREWIIPALGTLLAKFKALCPDVPVTYYSKGTGPDYWDLLKPLPIDAIGIDWHHDISQVLDRYGERWAIQGNVDPQWLFMDCASLDTKLREVFSSVLKLPAVKRRGWICGLGHGVLPKTPEENVRHFIKLQREVFE